MATAIGYAGGGKISAWIDDSLKDDFVVFLSFAVMSMAIAVAQWLVIRRHIRGLGWLWTTLVGGAIGGSLSSWASFQLAIQQFSLWKINRYLEGEEAQALRA